MKQPMSYGKGKAHQIRTMRKTAASLRGNTKIYSRMDSWVEENAGTPQFIIRISLKIPWSFSELEYEPVKEFPCVATAMRGIHGTYLANEEALSKASAPKEPEKTPEEKLKELVELTNKW